MVGRVGARQPRCMPGAAVRRAGAAGGATLAGRRERNYNSQSGPRSAGVGLPCWRKGRGPGGDAGRDWLRREGGGRGLARAGRAAEAAAAGWGAARGQAGMEPAEGPGALGFHGDEEIIEVVELGPPGPGETGRPCRVRGPAGSPASHRGTGPAPAPPQCWARPRVPARSPPAAPGLRPFPASRSAPLRLRCSGCPGRGGIGMARSPGCPAPQGPAGSPRARRPRVAS